MKLYDTTLFKREINFDAVMELRKFGVNFE